MKKAIAILLTVFVCLSLCACNTGNSTEPTTESATTQAAPLTKDEMLAMASPLTREQVDKSIGNAAYANSLTDKVYTFGGVIGYVEADHAVATFYITDEEGSYATALNVLVAKLYLPQEELINLENSQRFTFVGKLDEVGSSEIEGYYGMETVMEFTFNDIAIVSDRFENTGVLDSMNHNYGDNSWNIKFPGNDYLGLVFFAEDVSEYKGQEITYSYKSVNGKAVDAYIVK